jgi:menaquinone-dependent protoporphyrinogen IX oxidase
MPRNLITDASRDHDYTDREAVETFARRALAAVPAA